MSGVLFIVSAPSGAGKTSLVRALLEADPRVRLSVSHTTRPARPGEVDGRDYHFVSEAGFQQLAAQKAFLEHAEVFGRRYGTARSAIEPYLAADQDVFLDIDWQGARLVRQAWPGVASVFILPPSRQALETRLRARGQDSPEEIARRMALAQSEMSHYAEFDYLLVNDDFATALAELRALVRAERLRMPRQRERQSALVRELLA